MIKRINEINAVVFTTIVTVWLLAGMLLFSLIGYWAIISMSVSFFAFAYCCSEWIQLHIVMAIADSLEDWPEVDEEPPFLDDSKKSYRLTAEIQALWPGGDLIYGYFDDEGRLVTHKEPPT